MTAKQLRRWLATVGYTQAQLATALGINERTVRRYLAGEQTIPQVVVLALETVINRIKGLT